MGRPIRTAPSKACASAEQINKLRKAWDELNNSISSRNLSKALAGAERTNFKIAATNEFMAISRAWNEHASRIEKRTHTMAQNMRTALQPVLVALGGYTGAYLAGRMGTEGLKAASEEQRQKADAKFSGLSEGERTAIQKRSEELAVQYKMPVALLLEMLKDAALNMPDTKQALDLADPMARSLLVLSNMFGSQDGAIEQMRAYNKAMDNLNINTNPEEYLSGLQNFMKMQQVIGKDIDPRGFALAIKYARSSGKVYSHDFLFKWLPLIMAERGGPDAGTSLRAGFDQFIVGRASKKALAAQKEYGLRDDDGRVLKQNEFSHNPIKWANEVLLPALQAKGVDTGDQTELARVIGELTNNRLSSDLLISAIQSFSMYERLVNERFPNAMGLDAADQVQALNPFAAYQGFIDSLKNLAGAVGNDVMPTITAGLNSLAGGINSLQQAWRDGDPMAKLGITGAAVGAGIGAWKIAAAIWGLMTAGANLNTAAFALEAAAASLAKGGAVDDFMDGDPKKRRPKPNPSSWAWLGAVIPRLSPFLAAGLTGGDSNANAYADASEEERQKMRDSARRAAQRYNETGSYLEMPNRSGSPDDRMLPRSVNPYDAATEATRRRQAFEADTGPRGNTPGLGDIFKPEVDLGDINAATTEATAAGQMIQSALSVSATPAVNTQQIDAALQKAQALVATLSRVGTLAQQANASVSRQMNRNFTDQGVTP